MYLCTIFNRYGATFLWKFAAERWWYGGALFPESSLSLVVFIPRSSFAFFLQCSILEKNLGGVSMKKALGVVICALMVLGTLAIGYADQGDWRGGIRSRIHESKQKIQRGIERGTLNKHEAGRLNEELGRILDKIDRMKADGHLSQMERDKIIQDLDRLDRDILKEKLGNATVVPAERGDWRGGIRSRIQESKQKIERGIERGSLNRHEAGRLNEELGRILNKIDRMKADGRLSDRDRDKINRDLDRLDRDIAREKRDDGRRH
jgi:hypothetical protein